MRLVGPTRQNERVISTIARRHSPQDHAGGTSHVFQVGELRYDQIGGCAAARCKRDFLTTLYQSTFGALRTPPE